VTVHGEVVLLLPNEIVVEITYPVSGRWLPSHVPRVAMGNPARWYATTEGWQTTGLTEGGRITASEHLLQPCKCSKGDEAFAPPVGDA
jgi:hypothetical protein